MRMNTGIALGGQQPNFLQSQLGAVQMAGAMKDMQRQNRLAEVFQQHGPGIMSGDQNALAALGQVDPGMALGVQGQHQTQAINQERLQLARAEGQRAAQRLTMEMDAQTLAREREETIRDLRVLGEAYATGNDKAFNDYVEGNGIEGVSFENFPYAAAMIEGGLEVVDAATERHGPADSAKEQQIERLVTDYGLDRRTAIGVADGLIKVSRDPLEETIILTNIATNESWQPTVRGQQQAAPTGQQQPAPEQPEQTGLSFGQPYQGAPDAFGVEGALRGTVNTVTDTMGFGPAFPETMQTQQDFDVLKEKLINDIASGYARQPPSWLLRNIEDLTPRAGRVFEGPGEATAKLTSIGRDLETERDQTADSLRGRRLSPEERQKLEGRLSSLDAAISRVAQALAAFGTEGGGSNRTSSGVSWSVEE